MCFIKKISIHFIVFFACFIFFKPVLLTGQNFSPSDVSGLKLWINGDNVKSSSFPIIDTSIDLSGNNNNAFAPSSSTRPFVKPSILNGHKVFGFDGIDDFFNFSEISDIRTVFWILKENPTASSNYRCLLGSSTAYDFFRGGSKEIWHFQYAKNPAILSGTTSINSFTVSGISTVVPTQFSLISLITTDSVKANSFSYDRTNGGREWDGDLAELIIYNKALSQPEVDSVENYLYTKYAPLVNLGAQKKVCSFPYILKARQDYFVSYQWQDGSVADSFIVVTPGTYSVTVTDIFNRTSSSSISVIQDNNNYQVSLGNDTVMCQGKQIQLTAGPDRYTYTWSNGSTQNTIYNISSSVNLSVTVTDCMGNISVDSIKIIYPNYHLLDSVFCTGETIQWNTNHPKNQFNFLWSDFSTDSILNINQAGNYYVKITGTNGCSINSNTVTVTEDPFSSNVSLGPDVTLCAGNTITLTNGAGPSLTYTWSTSSNNDSLLINTSGQYSVVVTNTNNCIARDTINITISGQAPVANFTTSIGCFGSALSFTNLSTAPSGNTLTSTNWDFGDSASGTFSTSTATNPFHTFSDTGSYIVRLTIVTNVGCDQTITKTIHIAPTSTVNFLVGNSCQNSATTFTNQSTSSTGYSITSLYWNFGDGTSSVLPNPIHTFSNQSNYTIKLLVTNNAGCKDSLINIITVKPQVVADFTYSTPCTNITTIFQDNSIAASSASSTRLWNFGNSTAPGLTVSKTYTATGPYNVSLTVTVNGCTSNISKIITIFSPPAPNFTIPAFCSKDTATTINSSVAQSGIISSYNWKLNNNFFSSVQNPTLSLIAAGTYSVRLTAVNSFGCRDSISKTVTVSPLPNVDFNTSPVNYYYINSPVTFLPTITNASTYFWNMSSVSTSTIQSPSVTFNVVGIYTVSLNLKDQQGCKGSKTKTILVSKPYLDLAILNVTSIKDDSGFITVLADIANYGTIPATVIDMQYQISDGGNNKETWNGILNPNSFFTYTFNSKSASNKNSINNITCVTIKRANGVVDENQNNNELCSALNYDGISVSNPVPNPTEGNITLPIILNKDIDYTISIYNSNGQMQYEETTQKGLAGLNLVTLQTSNYSRGCYIIKTVIDDKIFVKKFIKISNE